MTNAVQPNCEPQGVVDSLVLTAPQPRLLVERVVRQSEVDLSLQYGWPQLLMAAEDVDVAVDSQPGEQFGKAAAAPAEAEAVGEDGRGDGGGWGGMASCAGSWAAQELVALSQVGGFHTVHYHYLYLAHNTVP